MRENMYDAWDNGDRHEIRQQFARRDELIRLAGEAGIGWWLDDGKLERFAALVAATERNKVAAWMIERSYATGHGDTTEDLLKELEWQVRESEREACARVCEEPGWNAANWCAKQIRARGEMK